MVVKMNIEVEVVPFEVPTAVCILSNDGVVSVSNTDDGSVPLKDLNWETLNTLCNDFRKGVFAEADIKDHHTQ